MCVTSFICKYRLLVKVSALSSTNLLMVLQKYVNIKHFCCNALAETELILEIIVYVMFILIIFSC